MGKFIVEKHNGESIWRLYENEYGDIAGEEAYLTLYTEPDLEQVRKEAYEEGYKKCLSLNNFGHLCVSCDKYEQGLADAWEAARKIEHLSEAEKFEIFGEYDMFHIMRRYTPAEAIEKIRQHEREQRQEEEQIQVGDEVIVDGEKCVVLVVDKDGFPEKLLEPDGYTLTLTTDVKLPKTGRRFPEIAAVLAKMKEES